MKVFQLNTFCGAGSTGRIAVEIARRVTTEGGECIIGYGAGDVSPDAAVYAHRIGSPLERKLHGAMRKLLDAEGYGSLLATRKLVRFLKAYKPDVVHLHNLHGCYLHLPTLCRYLNANGVPVVWTLHDCWPFTGHCAYFDYAQCERWQTECHDCPQLHAYPACIGLDGSRRNYRFKKKWLSGLPNVTLVPPCRWLQQKLTSSYLCSFPCRVIYNGVDRKAFHPMPSDVRLRYGIGDRKLVLAVASVWEERKGLRHVLTLAHALGQAYRVVVLGLESTQDETILALPRTSSTSELAAWYSAADCVVNPTLEDNMPLINLEALACGTPVAVFRTGGCPECIDNTCGRVVEQGNDEALLAAVRLLCGHKADWTEACLRRAAEFDNDLCYAQYCELYREVAR